MPPTTSFQGLLELLDNDNKQSMLFYGTQGVASWGGNGHFGSLAFKDGNGNYRLRVGATGIEGLTTSGVTTLSLASAYGWLRLMKNGEPTISLTGSQGKIIAGDHGTWGDLYLKQDDGTNRVRVNGYEGKLHLYDETGVIKAVLGPEGRKVKHWTLRLWDENGHNLAVLGRNGNLTLGGGDSAKDPGHDGDLLINDRKGQNRIHLDGDSGNIAVKNAGGSTTIKLDAEAGDILLFNADCAEEFETTDDDAGPGSVMVASEGARVARSDRAYDRRVVGVVSGAGGFRPGVVLGHRESEARRVPVAVLGRVGCLADASYGGIRVGDLLTTSETPGYAMRVEDHSAALGAVLGKALSPLDEGEGLVETLVSLR